MDIEEYLRGIAEQLVHELEPILAIKEVTANTELLGTYTEAAVRRLISRVVYPMRVSTGAVIDFPMPSKLRQLDVIIWAPFPAPAIFEIDGFALVPRSSAFGVAEIKRSAYPEVDRNLEEFAAFAPEVAATPHRDVGDDRHPGIGIICVLEGAPSARLQKLLTDNNAIAIFEKEDKASDAARVRTKDVLCLVNFLHYIGWRYRMQSTQRGYPQLVM